MFLALIELVVVVSLLCLGVTQVVLPLWQGTPLFPRFRREGRLQHELAEANENVTEAELEKDIAEKTREAESVRRTVHKPVRSASGSGKTVNR